MPRTRSLRAILTALGLITVTTFGLGAPAQAASPATALAASMNCGPTVVVDYYTCTVSISGGTSPYSVTFVPVYNARIISHTATTVKVACRPAVGSSSEVDADVTDAASHSVVAVGIYPCLNP